MSDRIISSNKCEKNIDLTYFLPLLRIRNVTFQNMLCVVYVRYRDNFFFIRKVYPKAFTSPYLHLLQNTHWHIHLHMYTHGWLTNFQSHKKRKSYIWFISVAFVLNNSIYERYARVAYTQHDVTAFLGTGKIWIN